MNQFTSFASKGFSEQRVNSFTHMLLILGVYRLSFSYPSRGAVAHEQPHLDRKPADGAMI